jgi:hypothetical protein
MVKYTCLICQKEFNKKDSFIKHTEKKKIPCKLNNTVSNELPQISPISPQTSSQTLTKPSQTLTKPSQTLTKPSQTLTKPSQILTITSHNNIDEQKDNINNNTCLFCGLFFNRKDNLKRHMDKFCKVKKLQHEEKETILELLIEKDKKLETQNKQLEIQNKQIELQNKKMEELQKTINEVNKKIEKQLNKVNTTNINKGVINNNIIIPQSKLVDFGSEDVSMIPKDVLNKLVSLSGYPAIIGCFNALHNNPAYPQGMNTFISDKSRNKGMIYKNGDWVQSPIKKIINISLNGVDKFINNCKKRIEKGEYNTEKDPKGDKILDLLEQRIEKYYNRSVGYDDTVTTKTCKEFEKTLIQNITSELCNIKQNVLNNYNKIISELENNDKIIDKEKTEKNIKEDMNNMLNKIDSIPTNIKLKNDNKKKSFLDEELVFIPSDSEYEDEDEEDEDNDDEIRVKNDDDEILVLKEIVLPNGDKVKKFIPESQLSQYNQK